VRRALLIGFLSGAAALALLCAPAGAQAANHYTWSMPHDFTTASPGSNPDSDAYGGKPWSYLDAASASGSSLSPPSNDPGSFRLLDDFSAGQWQDSGDADAAVGDSGSAGVLNVTPAPDRVSAIGWTSPLPAGSTVSVGGSVAAANSGLGCAVQPTWTLLNGTTVLATGAPGSIAQQTTVDPGDTLYLVIDYTSGQLAYSPSCATADVSLQITAPSSPPTVTLTSPGSTTGPEPTLSGSASTAFGDAGTVTVRLYPGSSAAGSPAQTLTGNVSSGAYSVTPSSPLTSGQYTAVAEQDDLAGDQGFSAPVTFTVNANPPTVTLHSLGSAPLTTSTPTFSGTADPSGDPGVGVAVYAGPRAAGTPVEALSATRASDGSFSVAASPALPDGQYTAVAGQHGIGGIGTSAPVTFVIKVHPPALTITSPTPGQGVAGAALLFAGQAGNLPGDSSQVTVTLYAGSSTSGTRLGSVTVTRSGATWAARWATPLRLGIYTVQATQSDDAGHTAVTPGRTFLIVSVPNAIGETVSLSRRDLLSATVFCAAPAGQSCTGDVLVLTAKQFRPRAGGPRGRLRLMFAYVTVPGGHSVVVTRRVPRSLARLARRHRGLKLRVSASLAVPGGAAVTQSAVRRLTLSR
jgi:hypothetical protein